MKRQILILVLVLAALLLAVFSASFVGESTQSGESKTNLFDLTREQISAFEIDNFTQGFYFNKEGEDWKIRRVKTELDKAITKANEDPSSAKKNTSLKSKENTVDADVDTSAVKADPVKISSLLTSLVTLKTGEPIATEKHSIEKFQINSHSLNIKLYDKDGKELGKLSVGKTGPNFMSTFVKKGDKDAVYLVDENLQGFMSYPYEQWLAKDSTAALDAPKPGPKAVETVKKSPTIANTTKKGATHAGSKNKKKH